MATPAQTVKSRRDKLAAIIRNRLELDEEWFPVTDRPSFFDRIEQKKWPIFENAFKRVVELGCRGDVLLTCVARMDSYNTEEVIVRQAVYDSNAELSAKPKIERREMERPPGNAERNSFRGKLDAAYGQIKRYETLLFELGQFEAPPSTLGPHLSADEALIYLPRLLKWCGRLLSNDSLGNFRTVESAGRFVPCVYVELVTCALNSIPDRERRLPLERVVDLLHEINGSADSDQADFLREAMKRFRRDYGSVYKELKDKIRVLHRSATEAPDGWRPLFSDERIRRSRLKS